MLYAERTLFSAEQTLLLRAAALQNGVSLYAALGGGIDATTSNAPLEAPAR